MVIRRLLPTNLAPLLGVLWLGGCGPAPQPSDPDAGGLTPFDAHRDDANVDAFSRREICNARTACQAGDRCCPPSCTEADDPDCAPVMTCMPRACSRSDCGPSDDGCGRMMVCPCSPASACDESSVCLSGRCSPEADGVYPGGYCVQYCFADETCGEGMHCLGPDVDSPGVCVASCSMGACRAGYVCADADGDGRTECVPAGTGTAELGAACEGPRACAAPGAICIAWSDGYCSRLCRQDSDCGPGGHCGFRDASDSFGRCARSCPALGAPCARTGYRCIDADSDGRGECAPSMTPGPTGAPCSDTSACFGGACMADWPDGYCTSMCSPSRSCAPGSHCVAFALLPSGEFESYCLQDCTRTCARDGYACLDRDGDGRTECVPEPGAGHVGDACETVADCRPAFGDVRCLRTELPDGYCSYRCSVSPAAPVPMCFRGGVCWESQSLCLRACSTDSDCPREGYVCRPVPDNPSQRACLPSATGTGAIGEPCDSVTDCAGAGLGLCLRSAAWRGGYCSLDCASVSCPPDSACVRLEIAETGTDSYCLDRCETDRDCRSGYRCAGPFGTDRAFVCIPRT